MGGEAEIGQKLGLWNQVRLLYLVWWKIQNIFIND